MKNIKKTKTKKTKYHIYCAAIEGFAREENGKISNFDTIKDAEDFIRDDCRKDIVESDCEIGDTKGFFDTYTIYEVAKKIQPEAKVKVDIILKNA